MKKSVLLLCFLLLVPFILAHGKHGKRGHHDGKKEGHEKEDKDHDVEPPYECKFKGANGFYNLNALYKNGGNAYSAVDMQGDTIFFNFCGDLSNEVEATLGCDPNAAVCVMTSFGAYINAGRPSEEWVVGEETNNVSITYTNGDSCLVGDIAYANPYQTTVQLQCADDDETEFNVTSVTYSDCQITINAVSKYACPRMGRGYHGARGAGFMIVLLPALCCCLSCLCLAACCRRRRKCVAHQRKMELATYQPVPQEAPQVPQTAVQSSQLSVQAPSIQVPQYPVPQVHVPQFPLNYQPYVVPVQYQFQPQYFQPPAYFYQQQTPVAPVEQANDAHIAHRENQVDEDEKLARELQAQFDRDQ